jgi:hypothetical protein
VIEMSWQDILKIDTKDAISDAKRFGNIDAELNTPDPQMAKIVRFISDFGKKHNLEGFEKLEEQANYGETTDGDLEWRDMDMRRGTSPPIWFRYSALNDIMNSAYSSKYDFDMTNKIRDAVKEKFGGFLYTDEGSGDLVTYRRR